MSFWATLDLKQFGQSVFEKLNNELHEGLSALAAQIPYDRNKFALQHLEKRASDTLADNVERLITMCREGVFVEPPDAYRKRPLDKDVDSVDVQIDVLEQRKAELKAELLSIELREGEFDRRINRIRIELSKVGQVQTPLNIEKIESISRRAKKLKRLVNASAELKAKLPDALDPKDVDALLEREQRSFSLQQLTILNERLDNIDK